MCTTVHEATVPVDTDHFAVVRITDIAELDVVGMAFSRLGDRMVTVAKEPDQKLIVWDVENVRDT